MFLGWILGTLVGKGIGGIDLALFTQDTPPPISAGGLRNAFFGSAAMCITVIGLGTPLGIAAGLWLAAYGPACRPGTVVRLVNHITLLGLFDWTCVAERTGDTAVVPFRDRP